MALDKGYDPKAQAAETLRFWEESGHFRADPTSTKPSYCIVMPPPNVTGALHMGHALVNTLQDILIRWKRMAGFETLWVPGIDHAGISTQTVVERHLIKTRGQRRQDLTREEFLEHVWAWKEDKEAAILAQLKAMGCSCDWSRYRFTMDEASNKAVRKMFKLLFDEGLIYRGLYLVNWDPVTQTALADDEVEYIDRKGFLYTIRYPLADGSGSISVATTRPETLLGDTAVAVHPDDPRYTGFIGKNVRLPICNREIPIIGDHFVDPEFGTGAVKITPAHDPNDHQMALRHGLPMINLMTPDGRMNQEGGAFKGLTFAEAREKVADELKALGLLEQVTPHEQRIGLSYRSKAVIEPYLSKQWFVKMSGFAAKLKAAVVEGRTKLIPKSWEQTYFHWVNNLRDWCISRQLWWGHRIPIWYNKADPEWVLCEDENGLPPEVAASPERWVQDPDALDTWFSSGLWPFSTLGWPDETPELRKFYPNAVLVTGHDILFFWVARMILMGEYAMKEVPFPESFLHGLIYGRSYWRENSDGGITYVTGEERTNYDLGHPTPPDVHSKWEKLSKSKGNVIDPIEVIDEYGADAMRMALAASGPENMQIDLDKRRLEEFKNFTNKIWNGARFVFMNLDEREPLTPDAFLEGLDENYLGLEDRWILARLNRAARTVNEALTAYRFDHAALGAYHFFWDEFCSVYVEAVKPVLFGKSGSKEERANKQKLLAIALLHALRLLHPMAPFITEELFRHLKERLGSDKRPEGIDPHTEEAILAMQAPACAVAPFPRAREVDAADQKVESDFELIQQVVHAIRNIRGEMNLPPGLAVEIFLIAPEKDSSLATIAANLSLLCALVKTPAIDLGHVEPNLPLASTGIVGSLKILIPLPEGERERERLRLEKEREKTEQRAAKTRGQLANGEFMSKAPPHLVEKTQEALRIAKGELQAIELKLKALSGEKRP